VHLGSIQRTLVKYCRGFTTGVGVTVNVGVAVTVAVGAGVGVFTGSKIISKTLQV
jgi:hypothetical protein